MDKFLGLLKVKVIRGQHLVKRDMFSSDPYVKLNLGQQEVRTHTKKKTLNPEWNEELTLCIPNPPQSLILRVFDKDLFSADDEMGDAVIDLQPLTTAAKLQQEMQSRHDGDLNIQKLVATKQNGFVEDSTIQLKEGKVVQDICIYLQNVESGQIELELKWHPLKA